MTRDVCAPAFPHAIRRHSKRDSGQREPARFRSRFLLAVESLQRFKCLEGDPFALSTFPFYAHVEAIIERIL